MSALHRFEQRLEHLVTGAFARAFRSAVQPMEIAAALQREVDNSAQILSRERRLAPNDFLIDLSPADFDRLSAYGETLSSELAQMLHEYADEQRYLFAGVIALRFQRSEELTTGRFRVRSQAAAEVTPGPGHGATDTAVSRAPVTLDVNGVRHPLEPPGLVIGRGSSSDLRIDDPGISRRHAEFRVEQGSHGSVVSVLDLGSTNGTIVDGRRVQHAVLDEGSTVVLGHTTIQIHLSRPAHQPEDPSAGPWWSQRSSQPPGQPAPSTTQPAPPSQSPHRPDPSQGSQPQPARRDDQEPEREDPAIGPGGWW